MSKTHDTASDVCAEHGEVHVNGPGGIAYSMTPEAAADTSDRLLKSSTLAAGQRVEADRIAEEIRGRHG